MSVEPERSLAGRPRAELREAWHELLTAARDFGYAVDELVHQPATPEQIAATELAIGRHLPDDLTELYLLSDGQTDWGPYIRGLNDERERGHGRWLGSLFGEGWSFNTLQQLESDYRSWADIRAENPLNDLEDDELTDFDYMIKVRGNDPVKKLYTCPDWIAFATDGGGNSPAVDLAPEARRHDRPSDCDRFRRGSAAGIVSSVLELLRLCTSRMRDPVTAPAIDKGVCLYTLEVPGSNDE